MTWTLAGWVALGLVVWCVVPPSVAWGVAVVPHLVKAARLARPVPFSEAAALSDELLALRHPGRPWWTRLAGWLGYVVARTVRAVLWPCWLWRELAAQRDVVVWMAAGRPTIEGVPTIAHDHLHQMPDGSWTTPADAAFLREVGFDVDGDGAWQDPAADEGGP